MTPLEELKAAFPKPSGLSPERKAELAAELAQLKAEEADVIAEQRSTPNQDEENLK
jgi:hypothetical protein